MVTNGRGNVINEQTDRQTDQAGFLLGELLRWWFVHTFLLPSSFLLLCYPLFTHLAGGLFGSVFVLLAEVLGGAWKPHRLHSKSSLSLGQRHVKNRSLRGEDPQWEGLPD